MPKPLLIFDFFGVVVEEVAHKWLYDHVENDVAKHIIATLFVREDLGEITARQCFKELEKITGVKAKQIEQEWLNLGQLRQDTYDFIIKNKDKYHIVLLSNASASFNNKFFVDEKINRLFKKKFISSELRMVKPDPQIFQYVLEHSNVNYSYAVMIDDNLVNIKAAQKIGLYGVHFTNMFEVSKQLEIIAKQEH
ncbi:MAG: HAD-IA family hydrolase [Erysipelotrichia bacterium]|nr:HAD-IA family hydrolase [Erysipelotrichia bacterium]